MNHVPINLLVKQLANARLCVRYAPKGAFDDIKAAITLIDGEMTIIESRTRVLGLHSTPDEGADSELEAHIYGYLKLVNSDRGIFTTAEEFGAAMLTDQKDAMIQRVAQAVGATAHILKEYP